MPDLARVSIRQGLRRLLFQVLIATATPGHVESYQARARRAQRRRGTRNAPLSSGPATALRPVGLEACDFSSSRCALRPVAGLRLTFDSDSGSHESLLAFVGLGLRPARRLRLGFRSHRRALAEPEFKFTWTCWH